MQSKPWQMITIQFDFSTYRLKIPMHRMRLEKSVVSLGRARQLLTCLGAFGYSTPNI